ncbi:DUF998 domain-containing protein [Kitasatospora atroaurantiaca]|uniref:Uncharacterized protein DUF998 n=1 Tax=Kitasatospora atroaurantiaca TaxID=285545 RepID=A0A561EKY8_9ACTN|nr:DUF998 domain-containing protein [Kitasatospora atroaurantiaca]TWE16271.1 uncharacterized protein DUF998 [Kitasatospora atroaurantiaca]
MRLVPWWALLSSAGAPVVLIGGWTLADLLRGPGYDPVTQTISSLAAQGAPGRWLMVGALAGLGACHFVTALGLRAASLVGRAALAGGGVASILVALFPQPQGGGSLRHGAAVGVGFALLSVWPCLAVDRSRFAPWGLKPAPSVLVTASMLAGAMWFMLALRDHGAAGVAERVVTAAQSFWPFIVAVSCVLHASAIAAAAAAAGPRPSEAENHRRPWRR